MKACSGLLVLRVIFALCASYAALYSSSASAKDYYISVSGTPMGTGSTDSPWDISTGLRKTSVVKAGDTVWLRGGTYGQGGSLVYSCTLSGNASHPVILRQYSGEHAKLNGAINVSGSYVWLWGFEITNSSPQREVADLDKERPRGIVVASRTSGVKVINMIIHDVGRAGVGGGGNGFEIYGTLLWGNGIYDTHASLKRGDAVYLNLWHQPPDSNAINLVRDNISFRNFYAGFKIYSEWRGVYIDSYDLEGNVSFDNGPRTRPSQGNFLVRAERDGPPIKRLRVIENYSYRARDSANPFNAEFGCQPHSNIECEDAVIRDNYFVAGTTTYGALKVQNWQKLVVSGNTAVANGTVTSWLQDFKSTSVTWDNNSYYAESDKPFSVVARSASFGDSFKSLLLTSSRPPGRDFSEWKSAASADSRGTFTAGRPSGVTAIVRKNVFEPGERANIIIFNWDRKPSISVDLAATGLADGTAFEIVDVQNYFGRPILTGVYSAKSPAVSLPMNMTAVAPPVGRVTHLTLQHTAPEFAVFVLRKTANTARSRNYSVSH